MRCLYCGIKLKIAVEAKVIKHCPECSLRTELEGRRAQPLRAENSKRSVNATAEPRFKAFAAPRSA